MQIKVESLTQYYGQNIAINDVSFDVKQNRIHALIGPNGAGKSTTLKIISGLLQSDKGVVHYSGKSFLDYKNIFKDIGFLIDEPCLYHEMKVEDYLFYILGLKKISKRQRRDYVFEALSLCDLISQKGRLIKNLSKGFRQRVAIAGVIVHKPRFIILDEWSVGLDIESAMKMRQLILKLKESHTIIVSGHMMEEVEKIADDVTLLFNGKVLFTGTKKELLGSEKKSIVIQSSQLDEVEKVLRSQNIEFNTSYKSSLEEIFMDKIRQVE